MSIRVDPLMIGEQSKGRPFVYVLTTRDGRVHAVAHRVTVDGATVSVPTASDSLTRRVERDPAVTLLWPPSHGVEGDRADYSLIADGEGSSRNGVLTVVVTSAILHRPAP